jgi:hypothetical protein
MISRGQVDNHSKRKVTKLNPVDYLYCQMILNPVLRIRIRDGKKSGCELRNERSESYFRELRIQLLGLKHLSSLARIRTLDPGSFRPWIRDNQIRIRDSRQTSWIRNTGMDNYRLLIHLSVSKGGQKRGSKKALQCYAVIVLPQGGVVIKLKSCFC